MPDMPRGQRRVLMFRSDHHCEAQLVGCLQVANNAHHRKNRSQGGTNELSNLLLVCGSGTTGCHGWITEHPAEARRMGLSLWRSDNPEDTPVKYRGFWARLDNDGNVHVLKKGQVRDDLGHLSITQ